MSDTDQGTPRRLGAVQVRLMQGLDVQGVISFVDKVLEQYGGRLFEGYSSRRL